jgi:hypothetical protein
MKKTQLNVELPLPATGKVKRESEKQRTTQAVVIFQALEAWFSKYTPKQRRRFYRNSDFQPFQRLAKKAA